MPIPVISLSLLLSSNHITRYAFLLGTRFFSRGIDAAGNTSNFNETEQIVLLDPIRDGYPTGAFEGNIKFSYVQTRGSIPIYWAQINNIMYTPKLQVMDLPNTVSIYYSCN